MIRFVTLLFLLPVLLIAQEYTLYDSDNSQLPFNSIYCIDFDQDGNIWFGGQRDAATGLATVSMLSEDLNNWTIWQQADLALTSLEDRVFYMACDDQGTMWFCTHFGVSWRKTDGTSGAVDFTIDKYTRTVEVDSEGKVYISVREDNRDDSRLYVSPDHGTSWDPNKMQDLGFGLTINEGNSRPEAYDVKEGADGQLWICTWYGVTKRNTQGTWASVSSLEGEWTYALTVDPSSRAWVPLSGNFELVRIGTNGSTTTYDSTWSDALKYAINDLEADPSGTLWLATDGGGLIALKQDGSFVQYDSASTGGEIPEDVLTHLEIKDGIIWTSTATEGILRITGMITALEDKSSIIHPKQIRLAANYPNPFNPETTIEFELQIKSEITLTVYNLAGQLVKTLVSGTYNAGVNSVKWDGKDSAGNKVSSGVYFYRLSTNGFEQSKKMILIK